MRSPSNRFATVLFLIASLLILPASARAARWVETIPVVAGYGVSLIYLTVTPPGARVTHASFQATYDNRGTGADAAYARFQLVNMETGQSWALRGSQLGWSGEGVFSISRSSSAFNGLLEGQVLWETLTISAPGSLNGGFRLLIVEDEIFEGPDVPDRP